MSMTPVPVCWQTTVTAENEKESKYCQKIARFFMLVFAVYERRKKGITISFEEKKEENTAMYRERFYRMETKFPI